MTLHPAPLQGPIPDPAPPPTTAPTDRVAAPVDVGRRVLVIDDALTVRRFVRRVLEDAGFAVAEAINGLEGLEIALGAPPDLVVTDVNMTRMDGCAFVREARSRPDLVAVPIVVMSSESGDGDILRAFEAGANHYLVKPVRPEALAATARMLTGLEVP